MKTRGGREGGSLTTEDLDALRRQLGREPTGCVGVEVRCPAGHPLVVKVYPLPRTGAGEPEPFPTLFWLSCPAVCQQISALEAEGWIPRLEERIRRDPELRAAVHEDHRRAIEERWELLSVADRALVRERGWESALREKGIGGTANFDAVKCLHMHYAAHLARGARLGAAIDRLGEIRRCGSSATASGHGD